MGETRVNLKHLLEDIRDSYPFPVQEAIITELIANALDSGASNMDFVIDASICAFQIIDNGKGMSAKDFEEYHDIAATTKIRGEGIGFAGVGVKLSLLLSEKVVTETKTKNNHQSSMWQLDQSQRAPWEFIEPKGSIRSATGTSVTFFLPDKNSSLLDTDFVSSVIQKHFYPLLHDAFMENILVYYYKNGVRITVNGTEVELPHGESISSKSFFVRIGKLGKPVGVGFLDKASKDLDEDKRGIAVSTFGKVIKRGWDWLGVHPRNPALLTGIVEIPKLSEILTLNKADFLKDANNLQKYYRFRKAAQEAIEPILREIGEISTQREQIERDLRPLQKQIEEVLTGLLPEFPELNPLLGRRGKGAPTTGIIPDPDSQPIGTLDKGVDTMSGTQGGKKKGNGIDVAPGDRPGERIEPDDEPTERGFEHEGHRKRPGLMIGFEHNPARTDLGWLNDSTIWINEAHPAYMKATDYESKNYHIVLVVSWVLSYHLGPDKSQLEFLNRFLSAWGQQ